MGGKTGYYILATNVCAVHTVSNINITFLKNSRSKFTENNTTFIQWLIL